MKTSYSMQQHHKQFKTYQRFGDKRRNYKFKHQNEKKIIVNKAEKQLLLVNK